MDKGSNARIVVVDDDSLVREAVKDCLESRGYTVEGFGSAEDFLDSDSRENSSCLILDLKLPGINGLELQERLSQTNYRAPIIFVTAHGTDNYRNRALTRGALGFLSKPFRPEDLLTVVEAALQL